MLLACVFYIQEWNKEFNPLHIDKVCQMGHNHMTSYSWDIPLNRFYYYHAIHTSGIGKLHISWNF